ncbi:MAG: tetratricopeptide repeat protein [Pirellulales bacterium]
MSSILRKRCFLGLGTILLALTTLVLVTPVAARPSAGQVGGGGLGGARPAGPSGGRGGMSAGAARPAPRPTSPQVSRPAVSHPQVSRPAPSAPRPTTRPSSPSLGGLHTSSRPAPGGGATSGITRPAVQPPGNLRPATRPDLGGVTSRPGGGTVRPPLDQKPGIIIPGGGTPGGGTRPPRPGISDLNRPTTLPGIVGPSRPEGKPGPGIKPDPGGRPTTLPGVVGRPGLNPPWPEGRPPRPGIGGRPHPVPLPGVPPRPNPSWWNRPDWGWGHGWHNDWQNHWHDHWYGHHVHHHYHGWYHGCWNRALWYAPVTFGVTTWGYGSWSTWGLGVPYVNPYYVAAAAPVYDYSQPIVVNNYMVDGDVPAGAPAVAAPPADDPALALVDEAREQFAGRQYRAALATLDRAARRQRGDPVIHELRALCQFALGDYRAAAATLNALLASAPGMDWTTLSSLYADSGEYTGQLRRLEQHCKSTPDDAAAAFVLAYHYLVLGENEAAIHALQNVVKHQPQDVTARRMLDALERQGREEADADEAPAPPPAPAPRADNADAAAPSTDLVGRWRAAADGTKIELTVDEQSNFVWQANSTGQPAREIRGQLVTTSDTLVLDGGAQGTMVGEVQSQGANQFTFRLLGMPESTAGLEFQRVP